MGFGLPVKQLAAVAALALLGACGVATPFSETVASVDKAASPRAEKSASPYAGKLLFADEFNGVEVDAGRWNRCHWWAPTGCTIASNNELEWYTPQQVEQRDGSLKLTAVRRAIRGSDGKNYDYQSGMVTTGGGTGRTAAKPKFAFRYGYLEARVRIPRGPGLWTALWLLPATHISRPEIDVFEIRGSKTDAMSMHLHTTDPKGVRKSIGERWKGVDLADGWHVFALDWKPGSLRWLVDGVEAWRVVGDQVPAEPMYIVANLAVGGDWPGPPTEATPFPSSFELDYVRVWSGSS